MMRRFLLQRVIGLAIAPMVFAVLASVPHPARALVTSASLAANPATYTGACPVTINFAGSVVGTAGSNFQFQFVRNGVAGPFASGAIPATGTSLAVSDSIVIAASGHGYDQIHVPAARGLDVYSPQAAYSVTCTSTSPAPSASPAQLVPYAPPLAPCPTCVARTYTLYPTQTATYEYHSGGGINFAPGCALPHYVRVANIPHPSGATWIGYEDGYSTAGCWWGDETEFFKFDTFLRFDFSGHPITHLYSAHLRAHVSGRYPPDRVPQVAACVNSVRLLTTAWPSGNDAGLLTGNPQPQGAIVSTQPASAFVTSDALDADVSKAFRPFPFVPPGSTAPLLAPTNLWVDDPHGWSNPHANDWCLGFFTGWRLDITADH